MQLICDFFKRNIIHSPSKCIQWVFFYSLNFYGITADEEEDEVEIGKKGYIRKYFLA